MRVIGNIFWVLPFGLIMAILWCVAGLLCCITIVGIPLGVSCFKFAAFVIWPFGREIDYSEMCFGSIFFNVLWIMFCGVELATVSLTFALIFAVTIIGIPFAIQWLKFTKLAIMPFGAKIVAA